MNIEEPVVTFYDGIKYKLYDRFRKLEMYTLPFPVKGIRLVGKPDHTKLRVPPYHARMIPPG